MNHNHIPRRHNIRAVGGRGRQSELSVELCLNCVQITYLGSKPATQKRRRRDESQYAKSLYLSHMPLSFHVILGEQLSSH
jgi:hypothetical protein